MTDTFDISSEIEISNDPQVIITPSLGALVSPDQVDLDIFPLSPLHFEECSLETIWMQPKALNAEQFSLNPLKSQNGLKNMSWHVKEIVDRQKSTTYKRVADETLLNLEIQRHKISLKDEKNVRRRVYDALNVLVAAGVIEKQGKYISTASSHGSRIIENPVISQKRKKLKHLVDCCIATKSLYERNNIQSKISQHVAYPISIITVQKKTKYNVQLLKTPGETAVTLNIQGGYDIIRDISILKKIGLHRKTDDLPSELRTLCKL